MESKHAFGMSIDEAADAEQFGSVASRASSQEKLKNGAEASTTTFENYGLLYKDGMLVKQPAPTSVCPMHHPSCCGGSPEGRRRMLIPSRTRKTP